MNKTGILFLTILFLAYLGCNKEQELPCPPCISPAFVIRMHDSLTNNNINGFTITAINQNNDSITVNDTLHNNWAIDSCYQIFGGGSNYTLEITHPNYLPITLTNMVVEQGKCNPNTRVLNLYPKQVQNIIKDSLAKGCGNP